MVQIIEEETNIRSLPLTSLSNSVKDLISDLLNPTKVIPTDGVQKLYRDWRGLADLANIPYQKQANIRNCPDQMARVLHIWSQDSSVTVGNLLDNLERLERFDVYDDLIKYFNEKTQKDQNISQTDKSEEISSTVNNDDAEHIQCDVYLLYADEDNDFVTNKLVVHLEGFQICTRKMLPDQTQDYEVLKLITERCQRVIPVYSPDFLASPDGHFFSQHAETIQKSGEGKIYPIMYRDCSLPHHLNLYHSLRVHDQLYDFKDKLLSTLNITTVKSSVPETLPALVQSTELHEDMVSTSSRSLDDIRSDPVQTIKRRTSSTKSISSQISKKGNKNVIVAIRSFLNFKLH